MLIVNLVCTIMITTKIGGIRILNNADVEGKLVSQSDTKYLVDFTEGAKRLKAEGDYSQVLVNKLDCVRKDQTL